MDKETFYSQLSDKLSKLGVGQEYIDRHKKQFEGYFSGKNDEEVSAEIEKLGDLDRVAGRIKRMTDEIISSEQKVDSQEDTSKDDNKNEDDSDVKIISENISGENKTKIEIENERWDVFNSFEDKDDIEYVENDMPSGNVEINKEKSSCDTQTKSPRLSSKVMSDEEIKEKNKKFNIILACCSPVILIALLIIALGFAVLFFALASVLVLAVAALVAVTAGGTVIALFGLIFSITMMPSCFPIGLYECGLSIMIGAAALLLGIAIYNFIVHFMPFVAKKLIVFVKYVIRKIKKLFFYAKKEYIGL